jgi:hypothetical protein
VVGNNIYVCIEERGSIDEISWSITGNRIKKDSEMRRKKKGKGRKRAALNVDAFTGCGWAHWDGTNSKTRYDTIFHFLTDHAYHLALLS